MTPRHDGGFIVVVRGDHVVARESFVGLLRVRYVFLGRKRQRNYMEQAD